MQLIYWPEVNLMIQTSLDQAGVGIFKCSDLNYEIWMGKINYL